MKKITALLLTAVLLAGVLQPVYEAYASDNMTSVSPDQAAKSTDAQTGDYTFEFASKEPYDTGYYNPTYVDNSSSLAYAGQNTSDSPITVSVSSSNTDLLKITSGAKLL